MKKLILFVSVLSIVSLASCDKTTYCTVKGVKNECYNCSLTETKAFNNNCYEQSGAVSK